MKTGETQAKIEFLDGCMDKCEYLRQYSKILKGNQINVAMSSIKRQADNEKETHVAQLDYLQQNLVRVEHVLDFLTPEEKLNFYTSC